MLFDRVVKHCRLPEIMIFVFLMFSSSPFSEAQSATACAFNYVWAKPAYYFFQFVALVDWHVIRIEHIHNSYEDSGYVIDVQRK